jgi:hypothetical protein
MTARTYILVGAGGTGSLLFPPLMRYLPTHHGDDPFIVAIIDGDNVEASNLTRQMFTGNYVDENKATALARLYGSEATTRAIPEFLGEDNLERRIRDGNTVMICADNFDVRRRIEKRALELENCTVINGGNETTEGSLQIFVRRGGVNVTPPLSWRHPEILRPSPYDPSVLSCAQRAELPGGGQTIIANMMSATHILNALTRLHAWEANPDLVDEIPGLNRAPLAWHELHFDLETGNARSYDQRTDGWSDYVPQAELVAEGAAV